MRGNWPVPVCSYREADWSAQDINGLNQTCIGRFWFAVTTQVADTVVLHYRNTQAAKQDEYLKFKSNQRLAQGGTCLEINNSVRTTGYNCITLRTFYKSYT